MIGARDASFRRRPGGSFARAAAAPGSKGPRAQRAEMEARPRRRRCAVVVVVGGGGSRWTRVEHGLARRVAGRGGLGGG